MSVSEPAATVTPLPPGWRRRAVAAAAIGILVLLVTAQFIVPADDGPRFDPTDPAGDRGRPPGWSAVETAEVLSPVGWMNFHEGIISIDRGDGSGIGVQIVRDSPSPDARILGIFGPTGFVADAVRPDGTIKPDVAARILEQDTVHTATSTTR